MPRLVGEPPLEPGVGQSFVQKPKTRWEVVEDYLERVAKFVPAEIIGAYIAIKNVTPSATSPDAWPGAFHVAIYFVLLGLTPAYMWFLGGNVRKKKVQVGLSIAAFLIWTYALGGPFFEQAERFLGVRIVIPTLSAVILIIGSLVLGLFDPNRRPRK